MKKSRALLWETARFLLYLYLVLLAKRKDLCYDDMVRKSVFPQKNGPEKALFSSFVKR